MKKYFLVLSAMLACGFLCAQELSQKITGRVADKFHEPLPGAGITLSRDTFQVSVLSDTAGFFSLDYIEPGRYSLAVTFTGYQVWKQEVLITSSRPVEINIFLEESAQLLSEVEISAKAINDQLGSQTITIEKTLRVPANFFDPVRVITSYPGVMTANDQNNIIIVRGNSPAGLLWKINGLDVVNPNHLANAGTFSDKPAAYGGGVNIVSSQLLSSTDFYAGSLPVSYGNALSGVVDMRLREGDKKDQHYTLQASLIGLDAAAEGPMGNKKRTSYLVNYRYSMVGLLSAMGAKFGDEDISFQDLTFSLDSRLSKERALSFFGFYGSSKNIFEHKDSVDWEIDKDRYDIEYSSKNFGTGVTFHQSIKKVNISTGFAVSGSDQARDQVASPEIEAGETNVVYDDQFENNRMLVTGFGRLTASLNSSTLETGVSVNYSKEELNAAQLLGVTAAEKFSGSMEGYFVQSYAQWRIFLTEKWIAQTGMRYSYFTYNNTGALEPRIALEYFLSPLSSFKFSYNLVSQLQQAGTYLNDNSGLELNKAHHLDLGYSVQTDKGFKFSTTAFYQQLFDVPVQKVSSSYSPINAIETIALANLNSDGAGENYGLEVLTEKSFFNKSYFIAGASWYSSTYEGSDGIKRSTRFDGNYTVNLTYGKEWSKLKKGSHRTFGVGSRILYLGGLRETPIIENPNGVGTVYDESKAFENKLQDYFRLDLRLNWRKNKRGYTRTIALDIQNVLNIQNEAYHYYDHVKNKINTQYQLGLIPILVYRVEF